MTIKKTCSVARDGRVSSPLLQEALIKGLVDSGIDVIDLEFTSTPALYFSQTFLGVDGSCMISASHNPGNIMVVNLLLAIKFLAQKIFCF